MAWIEIEFAQLATAVSKQRDPQVVQGRTGHDWGIRTMESARLL